MTPLEDQIARTFAVETGDTWERAGLARAREQLEACITAESTGRAGRAQRGGRRSGRGRLRRLRGAGPVASGRSELRRGEGVRAGTRRRGGAAVALRRVGGAVPALAVVGVALVLGVAAVLVLHGRANSGAPSTPAAGAPVSPGAPLIAQLAVLRRPQTAADRLSPAEVRAWDRGPAAEAGGRLLPSLSRLALVSGPVRLYLEVSTPTTDPDALWGPRDGNQVSILSVTPTGIGVTLAIPSVDLLPDAVEVTGVPSDGQITTSAWRRYAYFADVVPDDVATAEITLRTSKGHAERDTVRAVNNLVAMPVPSAKGAAGPIAFYRADGTQIPLSNAALVHARAQQQDRQRHQALLAAEQSRIRANPQILAAFAVFGLADTTPVRLADGDVISHPTLNELPTSVLEESGWEDGLDLRNVREVRIPSGQTMYVIPGRATICTTEGPPGGGGGCAGSLTEALQGGVGSEGQMGAGAPIIQEGVRPRTHPVVYLDAPHSGPTIRPEAGVYILVRKGSLG